MPLQGRLRKLKGEEGLGGEGFAPFSLSAGTLLPQISVELLCFSAWGAPGCSSV